MNNLIGVILVLWASVLFFVFALHLLVVVICGLSGFIKGLLVVWEMKPALMGKRLSQEELEVTEPA